MLRVKKAEKEAYHQKDSLNESSNLNRICAMELDELLRGDDLLGHDLLTPATTAGRHASLSKLLNSSEQGPKAYKFLTSLKSPRTAYELNTTVLHSQRTQAGASPAAAGVAFLVKIPKPMGD